MLLPKNPIWQIINIEAFQMTKENRQDNSDWPNWLNRAWQLIPNEVGSVYPENFPMKSEKIKEAPFDRRRFWAY